MPETKSPNKSNLLAWLFCIWSFQGYLRNLFPSLSELLYFAHVPIVLLVILKTLRSKDIHWQARFPSWILAFVFFIILVWQSLVGIVNVKQILFVFLIYILGAFSVPFISAFVSQNGITDVVKVLPYVVFLNLLVSLNQIVFKTSFFVSNRINEAPQLGTTRNVLRATGTFTSPGAYALFVSVSLAIVLWSLKSGFGKKHVDLFTAFMLAVMAAFSGSRSLLLYIALGIVVSIIFSGLYSVKFLVTFGLAVLTLLALAISTFLSNLLSPALAAFVERIQIAPSQESTSNRIWEAFFGFSNIIRDQPSLIGEGLGGRTNAILGYQSPNWIEEELSRVTVEGGAIAGLIFVGVRCWLFILIVKRVANTKEKDIRFFLGFLFGSFATTLLVGSITGQGSTAVCFILVTGILLGLLPNSKNHNTTRTN